MPAHLVARDVHGKRNCIAKTMAGQDRYVWEEKGFHSSVLVGLHVRRRDKLPEHAYTPVAGYMTYVDQYF